MVPALIVWYTEFMQNAYRDKTVCLAISLFIISVLCAGPASAQKGTSAAIDPKALDLLKQSVQVYKSLHSYSCQAQAELKVDSLPGSRIIKIILRFQSPDKAAVSVNKYGQTLQYLSDGKSFYVYNADAQEFTQDAIPPDVPAAAPVLMQGESFIGLTLLKPNGLLTHDSSVKSLTLGPPELLNGTAVRTVVKVMSGRGGGQITFFVTIGSKDHLIYRFANTLQSPKPLPTGDGKAKRIDNSETYTDIKVDPVLPASAFLPPLSAKQVEPDKQDQKQ